MERLIGLLLLLLSFAACVEQPAADTGILAASDHKVIELGLPYDSSNDRILNEPCVVGDVRLEGSSTSEVEYLFSQSAEDLLASSKGKGKASAGVAGLKAQAKVSFLSRVAETDSSTSVLFKYNYELGAAKLWNKKPAKPELIAMPPIQIAATCGDRFVDQVLLGAQLFLAMNVHFESKEMKNHVKAQIKVKAFGHKKTFKKTLANIDKEKVRGKVSIEAMQIGGDERALDQVLGKFTEEKGARLVCDLFDENELDRCLDLQEAVIRYAKRDFSRQLGKTADISEIDRLAPLRIITKDYRSSGLPMLDAASIGK
jgi:hypothetical protein